MSVTSSCFCLSVHSANFFGPSSSSRCRVPSGGRVAYLDTTRQLPGFVELIELGGAFESVFSRFYRASIGWDGAEPVRSFI